MFLREVVYFHDSKIPQPNIPCVSATSTLRCDNGPRAERARLSDREWPRGRGGTFEQGRGAGARSVRGQAARAEPPACAAHRCPRPRATDLPPSEGPWVGEPGVGGSGAGQCSQGLSPPRDLRPSPAPPPTRGSPARTAPPPGMLDGGHVTDGGAGARRHVTGPATAPSAVWEAAAPPWLVRWAE